jgi:hypothetical protein
MCRTTIVLFVAACGLLAGSCQRDGGATQPSATRAAAGTTAPMDSFTGTLQEGIVAIGGETTGWRLVGDAESGGMEIDVSRVRDKAAQLAGRRVTVTGRLTERDYVERGKVRVLVAERIDAAPPR